MPPKTGVTSKTYNSKVPSFKDWREQYDIYILNPFEVQEETCKKLQTDFGLSKAEAQDYYEMIKDDENNKLIEEIRNRVRVKVDNSGTTFDVV